MAKVVVGLTVASGVPILALDWAYCALSARGVGAGAFGLSVLTGLGPAPGWYGPLPGIVVPGE